MTQFTPQTQSDTQRAVERVRMAVSQALAGHVATFDQPMIAPWASQYLAIQVHFATMQHDRPMPYQQARLPQVLRPEARG
jgi:hypothetical protein